MGSKLAWLALFGALGTLARFGLGTAVRRVAGDGFPWGTLVVNSLGCFLFGLAWSLAEARLSHYKSFWDLLLIGFLGAFTTYSTFAFETGQFLRTSHALFAFLNIAAQLLLGLGLLFAGLSLGRLR